MLEVAPLSKTNRSPSRRSRALDQSEGSKWPCCGWCDFEGRRHFLALVASAGSSVLARVSVCCASCGWKYSFAMEPANVNNDALAAAQLELGGNGNVLVRRPFDPVAHELDANFRLTRFADLKG